MGMMKKHTKQLKKMRKKREEERLKREPDIDFDTSAYKIYNRLEMTYPCLSFDIVTDDLGSGPERVTKYPISLNIIAGAQTPPHVENNYIYVMKVNNINALKQENEDDNEDDDEESEDEADDPEKLPKLSSVRVAHKGCVNRLRIKRLSGKTLTATWSDRGKVHVYDLTNSVRAVEDQKSINTYVAQKVEPKPIFTFGGHLSEGYGIDWSSLKPGSLATGDCKKNLHIWTLRNQNDWSVDQQPLIGHEDSVEDIKWSPEDSDVLASCSVDKSICIWDLREQPLNRCVYRVKDSHKSDVNVIDWNKVNKHLMVSGGDDGVVNIWDLRYMKERNNVVSPVAQFDYHKKPITSVEWDPHDDTVIAVASEDNILTLWDLAVEKDDEVETDPMEVDAKKSNEEDNSGTSSSEEEEEDDDMDEEAQSHKDEKGEEGVYYGDLNFKTIPEQLLFLHQGQVEVKELHWHPQLKGLIISTALNGLNIFKTISA